MDVHKGLHMYNLIVCILDLYRQSDRFFFAQVHQDHGHGILRPIHHIHVAGEAQHIPEGHLMGIVAQLGLSIII